MKTALLFTLACAGFTAAQALDLTPIPSYRLMEGVKIPVVSFDDGLRKVNWQPPANWQLSGGDDRLTLYPAQVPLAAMDLRLLTHQAAQIPDATTPNELLKWAAPFLPGDATNLAFVVEAPSPFLLEGKPCRELTFNYVSVARKCTTSIAVLDLDENRSMAVVITSRAEDFKEVHATGTKSMFRWNWIAKPLPGQSATASIETPGRR